MKIKLFTLLSIVFGIQLMAQTSNTPDVELQSDVMSAFTEGWNSATINVMEDAQIIFKSETLNSPLVNAGYSIDGGTLIDFDSPDTLNLTNGQNLEFRFKKTPDFSSGFDLDTVSFRVFDFYPGFQGQFAPENWNFTEASNGNAPEHFYSHIIFANVIPEDEGEADSETCSSFPKRNNFEWIESIKVGELSFSSGKNENAYGDYTETPLVIQPAEVLEVELTPGYKNRNYTEYWRIWIDINNDGDYSDEGEMVFEAKGKGVVEGDIPFPDGLVSPDVRVKVAMSWKNYPPLCGSFNSGEVEEYIIQLENVD